MKLSGLNKLSKVIAVASLSAMAAVGIASSAQAKYPDKPITIIVPWGAGGGTDTTARIIGKLMQEKLGVPVNVVNRTGGQGVIGHTEIAKAKPDGCTLGIITAEITMMHWQGLTDLTYKDYTPLGKMVGVVGGIEVKKGSKFKDAKSLFDYIRANPGKLTASGTSYGGIWHLNMLGMLSSAGLKPDAVRWVPAEGAAPALQELVANGVDFATTSINESAAMIEAGEVTGLAVTGQKRSVHFPDVPTLKEATGYTWKIGSWNGLVGPKGLPKVVMDKLLPITKEIQADPELKDFVTKRKLNLYALPADEWSSELAVVDAAIGKTMKEAGLIK
ncbi:Bug family tripartite tricarboxylate transporter substrate binding protein [Polycladidibacter stylochi]|uniref:Bug family tripartite tricarboxylate transporter substrate binding protein n=1 Tax=Polycladidibacter stylochi TaxID=1807766 RepID=UPI0008363C31|nr:tripartite tricarboxylate transporter substrate binding protein [Pseudovibrio stylochi]